MGGFQPVGLIENRNYQRVHQSLSGLLHKQRVEDD